MTKVNITQVGKNIFLPSGYLNYEYLFSKRQTINIVIAARGTGKSYMMKSMDKPFLYVRRTLVQLEHSFDETTTPFKAILGEDITLRFTKKSGIGLVIDNNTKKILVVGCAMTTFQSLAGIDLSYISTVVYDEFTAQRTERNFKHEFQAYKNIMEIVFRNRPVSEQEKISVWLLGNSNTITSPILAEYRLIGTIYKMLSKGVTTEYTDSDKGIYIALIRDSPISREKNNNPFYKALPDSSKKMEITNEFIDMDDAFVRHQNLKEYIPECNTPKFTIWRCKGDYLKIYVTERSRATADITYTDTPLSLDTWQKNGLFSDYKRIMMRYTAYFSSYEVYTDFILSGDATHW